MAEILLVIIATTGLGCIISGRLRPDLAALLVLIALGVTRVISPQEAFSGFSNSAIITIIGLSVITAVLEQTGAVRWVAHHLASLSGKSETRMIAVFMIAGALLSLVMNNIAAGAVLLPAAVRVARQAQIPASKILMPLSFGALLGGMATLFTTANILRLRYYFHPLPAPGFGRGCIPASSLRLHAQTRLGREDEAVVEVRCYHRFCIIG